MPLDRDHSKDSLSEGARCASALPAAQEADLLESQARVLALRKRLQRSMIVRVLLLTFSVAGVGTAIWLWSAGNAAFGVRLLAGDVLIIAALVLKL